MGLLGSATSHYTEINIMALTNIEHIANWNKKTINIGAHKVVYITNTIVDCFFNRGWKEQIRIKIDRYNKSFTILSYKEKNNVHLQQLISTILKDIK